MYLGGTSHLLLYIITLLNCIFTYSANFQQQHQHQKLNEDDSVIMSNEKLQTGKMFAEINSTYFHSQQKHTADQTDWILTQNQLSEADIKPQQESVVPTLTSPATVTIISFEPTVDESVTSVSSINQQITEETSVTKSIIHMINNSSSSRSGSSNNNISTTNININNSDNSSLADTQITKSTIAALQSIQQQSPLYQQQNLPLTNQSQINSKQPMKTESAMLNYIYDQFAPNKHRHYDFRLGPHFEGAKIGGVSNVSVQLNGTAHLNCKVASLQDRTITWVQRKHNSDKLQLLTVGNHTYSADTRYTVDFQYPNNWRLKITAAVKNDEGLYECQISTYPPRLFRVYLTVNPPEVIIVNEFSEPLYDTFYEAASTIQLNCIVRYISMLYSVVHWTHNGRLLNDDIVRGGISVKTNLSDDGASSTLFVARVNKSDSGNYTCSIGPTLYFSTNVHVLNESLAELYHGNAKSIQFSFKTITSTVTSLAITTTSVMLMMLIWTLYFIECTSVR